MSGRVVLVGLILLGVFLALADRPAPLNGEPEATISSNVSITPPDRAYDPVAAGESLPEGYRRSLPRDAIFPVYEPAFRTVADTDWREAELVIGVEIDGAAKAYPIEFLNRREIVNDELAGVPILVTW